MNAMPVTMMMDRIGNVVLNVALLAAIPTALVAFLIRPGLEVSDFDAAHKHRDCRVRAGLNGRTPARRSP